jgi:uncharacterized protein (DUF608 family)
VATKKKNGKLERREFLKKVSVGGALAGSVRGLAGEEPHPSARRAAAAEKPASGPPSAGSRITFPRTFSGRNLKMIAFPLGGIGTGTISLGGRGQLRDWEIFNRPDKGNTPDYCFPAIWAQAEGKKPVARVLEALIEPPYEGPSGLGSNNVPGLPRLESCKFTGEFPLARIDFEDPELPAKVWLEAFTPFIPLEADDSGLPVAVLRYRVSNLEATPLKVSIAFSIENPVGSHKAEGSDLFATTPGRVNEYRRGQGIEGLLMRNPFLPATDPHAGTLALAVLGAETGKVTYLRGWPTARWWESPLLFWDDFSADGELGPEASLRSAVGALCLSREIAAHAVADYTFLLSWHFPNRTPKWCGWRAPKGDEETIIGNFYCTRFADAWNAAEYAAEQLTDLESKTRQFVAAFRESTLPDVVKEATSAHLSTLVTPVCFRTASGEFYGFEGIDDHLGCCFGNCTSVWNYEAATNHLFPSFAKSMRESAFGPALGEEGRMDLRQLLPPGREHFEYAAADGQMAQVMKLYLDWLLSGDTGWVRKMWPAAKRALEFAWISGGWDADRDGVMEGVQNNTYDTEFIGPNPLSGIWYLGALRAAVELASLAGDERSSAQYRKLFEQGSGWIDDNLFNGEYYIQQIRGIPKDQVAKGLFSGFSVADSEHPEFQLGEGCLVDQLVGQCLADVIGLGPLLNRGHIRKTLESIYRYNYKRNLCRHESVQRVFALNDEAALIICYYPEGKRPRTPFPYFAEIMTGFEYSAATLMLYHDMIPQGLEVMENIRRRYDGERRNPWDEAECGHHYVRTMASWAAVLALSGFRYHGAEKHVEVSPRITPNNFRCFWSTAKAWGTFEQTVRVGKANLSLSVARGELPCRTVSFMPGTAAAAGSSARLGSKRVPHQLRRKGREAVFVFPGELTLKEGDRLVLALGPEDV